MKIYHLPDNREFYKDFKVDLKHAKEVVIVSPYLSANIITHWRRLFKEKDKINFTIVYDIGNEKEGRNSGLEGWLDEDVKSSITWRYCERVHTKFYYFRFNNGYAFYHGSANFTNSGLGSKNGNPSSRNFELITRIKDKRAKEDITNLIDLYKDCMEATPVHNRKTGEWCVPEIVEGKRMEFQKILERLKLADKYFNIDSDVVLNGDNDPLGFVKGLFGTKNNHTLKMHTTNNISNPSFTLSRQELKWFLGSFLKQNCTKAKRKLLLVIKEHGTWDGKLTVIYVNPKLLFDFLAGSRRSKKVYFDKDSITINVKKKDDTYFINRYSRWEAVEMECLGVLENKAV
ncbi:NgoFVII family restriction endonuclease [Virgibacillus sp. MSP4-1]|uniref:restriction endonuclease PLD domain-containing protein n=1 Tax=Virgibacillus sp. MSP4-1 TaxID=2700081 RepID=UPI0003A33417|nr:restriction endonuclease PLD domain-containing protein [Virgibacillus sp. MSP4-1]QHS23452.1 NgoFVII family restriction endonuclease [Virgibacillus sp. MSP4-1]